VDVTAVLDLLLALAQRKVDVRHGFDFLVGVEAGRWRLAPKKKKKKKKR
jgi:hypothetical protein